MSLSDVYYDPVQGFMSAAKIYEKVKDQGYTMKQVREFIKKQETDQVNKHINKPKYYNTIVSPEYQNNFQIDIITYDRYEYHKYKYILCCIDVYSRYADARALTNRKNETVIENLESIFEDMGYPNNVNADNEFNTKAINKFFEENGVHPWYSQPDEINKNAIVERFNRTLAEILQKWRTGTKQYAWNKVLPAILKNYNNTVHGTIKAKPIDVKEGKDTNNQDITKVEGLFKVGDKVRTINNKTKFTKGDAEKYSRTIYKISRIVGNKIYIESDHELQKYYKEYELLKVDSTQKIDTNDDEEEEHKKTVKNKKLKKNLLREGIL